MKQCTNKEDNFQPIQQCSRSSVTIFHFENFYLILFFFNLPVSPPFSLKYQWQLSFIFLNILLSIGTSPRPLRNEVSGTQLAPYQAPHSGCESELYPLRDTSSALASHWCLSFLWQLQTEASFPATAPGYQWGSLGLLPWMEPSEASACPGSLAPPLPGRRLQRGFMPSRPYCYPQTFLPLCTPSGLWSLTLLTLSSPPSI